METNTGSLRPDIEAAIVFAPSLLFIEAIPLSRMNEWIDQLARQRPLIVSAEAARNFRHPWNIQARWTERADRKGFAWHFNVLPGMVGEFDPFRRIEAEAGEFYEAGIDDDPAPWFPILPSNLRRLGTDAMIALEEGEPVPAFFQERGVRPPATAEASPFGLEVTLSGDFDQGEARLLRACELVLVQPRPAMTAFLDENGIQFAFSEPDNDRPHLNLLTRFLPTEAVPLSVAEQLVGGFTDRDFEERHIATIYLLSPPGARWDSDPDETWLPYVEHHVTWNMNFAIDRDLSIIQTNRIEVPGLGLAGGVADLTNQAILDQVNGILEQSAALLNQSRIRGHFWTI